MNAIDSLAMGSVGKDRSRRNGDELQKLIAEVQQQAVEVQI
jgi:hypothetical protein